MTELNLNDKEVQKRLATQWGYVKAEPHDVASIREICASICDRVAGYEMATGKVTDEELPWAAFCASLIRGNKVNA